jgi:hypothetical protein
MTVADLEIQRMSINFDPSAYARDVEQAARAKGWTVRYLTPGFIGQRRAAGRSRASIFPRAFTAMRPPGRSLCSKCFASRIFLPSSTPRSSPFLISYSNYCFYGSALRICADLLSMPNATRRKSSTGKKHAEPGGSDRA